MNLNYDKIIVFAAHSDDEAIGCGGTLHKIRNSNGEIGIVYFTDGTSSRNNSNKIDSNKRKHASQYACAELNVQFNTNLGYPDNNLRSIDFLRIVKDVEKLIHDFKPNLIITHSNKDLNIDHRIVFDAVLTASRPLDYNSFCKEIICFETASSTEWAFGSYSCFNPDTYVDISDVIEEKIKLLNIYKEEMRENYHPRSIENIIAKNKLRGSEVNVGYAEGFETLRRII